MNSKDVKNGEIRWKALNKLSTGDTVYVVERENGEITDFSAYMFLSISHTTVVASSFVNNYDVAETLKYHIERTVEDFGTELFVFPWTDCYISRQEVEAAIQGETKTEKEDIIEYTWETEPCAEVWRNATSHSIKECMEDAIASKNLSKGDIVYIGECDRYQVNYVCPDNIIEYLQECAADEINPDVCDDWLDYVTLEQRADLGERLLEVVNKWLEDIGEVPSFYRITNIKEYIVGEEADNINE